MSYCPDCKQELRIGNSVHSCPERREREANDRLALTTCSAWHDPHADPPTMTGRILVWIDGIGPHLVNVSEMSFHFWDGQDDTEMTSPDEWDWWTEISPPNAIDDESPRNEA